MPTFFGVENEHIARLGALEAVQFFAALLHAEARRIGASPEIRVSERITVPDGGIDASASNDGRQNSALLKDGYSSYQIKTGTTFTLSEGSLRTELFGRGNPIAKANLGESVVHCLDRNGNLTFVCFGLDPVESEANTAIDLVKGWLKECGYIDTKVYIFGQGALKGFVNDFPSLRLKITGRANGTGLEILDSWQTRGDMEPEALSLGERQKAIIFEAQKQLLTNTEAIHLRVTGESGIGKTRLILEALKDERLRPLVLYTANPAQLDSQGFLTEIAMPDNHIHIILVLDECPLDMSVSVWNRLQNLGPRIRLITIHNEEEPQLNGTTQRIQLPPLEHDQMVEILRTYEIPGEYIDRWARFCEGSPRWARIIGANLQSNSIDLLADPDNVPVVTRYIAGRDDSNSQLVKNRKLVISYLSLFKRVGIKPPMATEGQAVLGLIQKYDPAISQAVFDDSVKNLHDRRILQGEKTYYITPKPLQVKLWIEWWENYSATAFNFDDFSSLPRDLVTGFNYMFRFAHESEAATRTVNYLLGPEGPFADGRLLNDGSGSDFFLALTEAAPEKALERLEHTVAQWDSEKLLNFTQGRHELIWAIERIAVWEGLFVRAMRVLLRLAEAENDKVYSNNSTGTFKDFFSLMSATEEPPLNRITLLEELITSGNPTKERIAIESIAVALENHFTRTIGPEHQGLRREPRLWSPRNNPREAHEYIERVWRLLVESLSKIAPQNLQLATEKLTHQLHVFGRTPGLASDKALETAREVLKQDSIDKNELIETVVDILHFGAKELPPETLQQWKQFYSELVPNDLSSLLNRFVGMNLNSDHFRDDGEYAEADKVKRISELAEQSLQQPDELKKNLPWLITTRAGNGYAFGYELGKKDKHLEWLPIILDARRNVAPEHEPSQYFLGGYLRAVYEADAKRWEGLFSELAKEDLFVPLLPELVWRAGHTDLIIEELLALVAAGKIDALLLGHFKYGVSVREFSEETLEEFVKLLMQQKTKGTSSIALDVFSRYYVDKESTRTMPETLAFEILTDPCFFVESEGHPDTMDEYLWARLAEKFLNEFTENKTAIIQIGHLMLNSLGNKGSIVYHIERDVKGVLTKISEMFPEEMWVKALDDLENKGYYVFKQWLGSGNTFGEGEYVHESILQKIKLETLWQWIDADIEKRAWYIANIVPKVFSNKPGEVCLAREVLIRYGDREDVRRNLHANFFSEGWSGPASLHHKKQLDKILPFRDTETNQNVIRWLDEYIEQRKQAIEQARTEEERGDFWR